MGVIIPDGFGQVSYHTMTDFDSEEMVWTCGLDFSVVPDPQDALDDLEAAWGANIQSLTSSVTTLVRIKLKYGPTSTGPSYEQLVGVGGTNGGALPPPNVAVLVSKQTALGGRKGRGRVYLPGISSVSAGLDSGGNIDATRQNAVTAAMEGWRGDVTAGTASGGFPPVLLHSDNTGPSTITAFAASNKLATQRRRLRP
jgi:hypothetical protein